MREQMEFYKKIPRSFTGDGYHLGYDNIRVIISWRISF